jgi:hypothetical protein
MIVMLPSGKRDYKLRTVIPVTCRTNEGCRRSNEWDWSKNRACLW